MTVQETSKIAYFSEVKPTLGARQEEVMSAFRTGKTFTNSELAAYLNWPINTVTPRVNELAHPYPKKPSKVAFSRPALLEEKERRHCSKTGRMAIVWGIKHNTTDLFGNTIYG